MSTVAQIEQSIQSLPTQDFFTLLGWMTERHLTVLTSNQYEAPELESALLKSLDEPRHAVNDALFQSIREKSGGLPS